MFAWVWWGVLGDEVERNELVKGLEGYLILEELSMSSAYSIGFTYSSLHIIDNLKHPSRSIGSSRANARISKPIPTLNCCIRSIFQSCYCEKPWLLSGLEKYRCEV